MIPTVCPNINMTIVMTTLDMSAETKDSGILYLAYPPTVASNLMTYISRNPIVT